MATMTLLHGASRQMTIRGSVETESINDRKEQTQPIPDLPCSAVLHGRPRTGYIDRGYFVFKIGRTETAVQVVQPRLERIEIVNQRTIELVKKLEEFRIKMKTYQTMVNRIEEKLGEIIGYPEEGKKKVMIGDYPIEIERRMNYSIDQEALIDIQKKGKIKRNLIPVKTSFTLQIGQFKKLRETNPDAYRLLSKAITKKPGKVTINVKGS